MGNFGADLKKAREDAGVTIEAIATSTKITKRYLDALEQERFDQLPGGVFRKSIVRSYARAAGLNENDWVDRYIEVTQPTTQVLPEAEDLAWMEFAQNVGRSRGREQHSSNVFARWAGVLALLLLVVGMSWFVWGYVHNKALAAARVSGTSALTAQSAPPTAEYQ